MLLLKWGTAWANRHGYHDYRDLLVLSGRRSLIYAMQIQFITWRGVLFIGRSTPVEFPSFRTAGKTGVCREWRSPLLGVFSKPRDATLQWNMAKCRNPMANRSPHIPEWITIAEECILKAERSPSSTLPKYWSIIWGSKLTLDESQPARRVLVACLSIMVGHVIRWLAVPGWQLFRYPCRGKESIGNRAPVVALTISFAVTSSRQLPNTRSVQGHDPSETSQISSLAEVSAARSINASITTPSIAGFHPVKWSQEPARWLHNEAELTATRDRFGFSWHTKKPRTTCHTNSNFRSESTL